MTFKRLNVTRSLLLFLSRRIIDRSSRSILANSRSSSQKWRVMSVAIIIHFYVSLLSSTSQLITPISDVRRTRPCLAKIVYLCRTITNDRAIRYDDKNHQEWENSIHALIHARIISRDNRRDYGYFEETYSSVTTFPASSITLQNRISPKIAFVAFIRVLHIIPCTIMINQR